MSVKQFAVFLFHKQIFLLIPVILFLWYTADALYGFTVKDLIPHTGKIVLLDTEYVSTPTKGYYFRFKINTEPNQLFKLITFPGSRNYIMSHLELGDTVTIFTEPKLLEGMIRRTGSNSISKLVKENKIIVDYSKLANSVSLNMMVICTPIFIGFFILYFIKTRRRYVVYLTLNQK